MDKKYEFTGETMKYKGHILHRIKRLEDGRLLGWIESEDNLSHEGECFVGERAKVYGNARVYGDSRVYGDAEVCDDAEVFGRAIVGSYSLVFDSAKIFGNALIEGDAELGGDVQVYDNKSIDEGVFETGIFNQ